MLKNPAFYHKFSQSTSFRLPSPFPSVFTIERLSDLSLYADSENLSFRGKRYD